MKTRNAQVCLNVATLIAANMLICRSVARAETVIGDFEQTDNGWMDWAASDTFSDLPDEYSYSTTGATLHTNSLKWTVPNNGTGNINSFYQGPSVKLESVPSTDLAGQSEVSDYARNSLITFDVTYNAADWTGPGSYAVMHLWMNAPGLGFSDIGTVGTTNTDPSLGPVKGQPDLDTGNTGYPGGWDPTHYPGITTRTMTWNYAPEKAIVTSTPLNGYVQFGLESEADGAFNTGAYYIDNVKLTSPTWNVVGGGSWNTGTNWLSGLIPHSIADVADFGSSITAPAIVTLDANQTVGGLVFDRSTSYTIAQGSTGTLTFDNGVTPATIYDNNGSHAITAPMIFTSPLTASVIHTGDTLTLSGAISGNGALTAVGPGTVSLGVNSGTGIRAVTLSALNLNGDIPGNVALPASSLTANRSVLVTSALNFGGTTGAWTGLLDLTKNDMIVHGGAVATIESQLKQGLAGTAGIESSSVTGSSPKTALGYGTMTGTFDGQAVTASDVVIKYTLSGDATLDGSVNFSDLLIVAQHYNGTSTIWQTGDFNYDGTTNFSDLLSLAQNYNKNLALTASQVSSLDAAGGASFSAAFAQAEAQVAVPEPTTLSLLGVGAIGMMARRRKTD